MNLYHYAQMPPEALLIRSADKSGVSDTVRAIIADV